MKTLFASLTVGTALFLISCNTETKSTDSKESTNKTKNEASSTNCLYSFNPDSTNVSWTAFKTTEKIGVDGKFDEITITGTQEGDAIEEVFHGASFEIPIQSINTNNPDRDMKIRKFFFGKLAETEKLTGSLKSLNSNGKGEIVIQMNDMERNVEMDYTLDGDRITLSTVIDVNEWNAQAGIEKLNEECYELHMAADGISKLWPDVKIQITSLLNKTCE